MVVFINYFKRQFFDQNRFPVNNHSKNNFGLLSSGTSGTKIVRSIFINSTQDNNELIPNFVIYNTNLACKLFAWVMLNNCWNAVDLGLPDFQKAKPGHNLFSKKMLIVMLSNFKFVSITYRQNIQNT